MSQGIKYYVIFETGWGYFGLAGREEGLLRSVLPIGAEEKVKSLLLKGLEQGCRYSRNYFKSVQKDVRAYYKEAYVDFDVPVCFELLTEFQVSVLNACRKIRYGQIRSYGQVAKMAGREGAVRAAGGALSKNPLPLIIPCHRVTYSDGGVGGFSAFCGVRVKQKMLEMERKALFLG
jgi:methylated-DNA-[protein]-cysteine S-methyltransferase